MPQQTPKPSDKHRVVIVGGGFGGLFAARALGRSGYDVTLLDKRNFHLFQPLLYQVATGTLTVGDISTQQRVVLRKYANVRTLLGTVYDVDVDRQIVYSDGGEAPYDTLIAATGVKHHYFGNDHWREHAPGLKTVEHALEMRHRLFRAFEEAEKEPDAERRRRLLTFVIVGGGPTGVELAGALGDLTQRVMVGNFRAIDPRDARIILVEGTENILPAYSDDLRAAAKRMLEELKVEVRTNSMANDVTADHVRIKLPDDSTETIETDNVLWAAGVTLSQFGRTLGTRTQGETDRPGRLVVNECLQMPSHPNIFVIGDLACAPDGKGGTLPGLAPVAMQQGKYVAKYLKRQAKGKAAKPFRYSDKGSMAIIARYRCVGEIFGWKVKGAFAWMVWSLVHIASLIEPDQRMTVTIQWLSRFFGTSADRLITGNPPKTTEVQAEHGVELERKAS